MWTDEQIQYLHDNHGILTPTEISKHVGKTKNCVRTYARRAGLKTAGNRRKHFFNEHFFNVIDSEDKAYFLGFISADGAVIKKPNSREMRLYGHARDIDIFKKFRNCIGLNTDIKTFARWGSVPYMALALYSKTIVDDLISLGVVPNKTRVIKFPNIESQYYNHYIRGYFDGDGSIYKLNEKSRKTQRFGFSIVSGSKSLIEHIYNILGSVTEIVPKIRTDTRNNNSYEIILKGKQNLLDVYNYMYCGATVFGERKKAKFDEFIIENSFETNVDSFHANVYTDSTPVGG